MPKDRHIDEAKFDYGNWPYATAKHAELAKKNPKKVRSIYWDDDDWDVYLEVEPKELAPKVKTFVPNADVSVEKGGVKLKFGKGHEVLIGWSVPGWAFFAPEKTWKVIGKVYPGLKEPVIGTDANLSKLVSALKPWLGRLTNKIDQLKEEDELDEGYHSSSGKFNSGHDGARLYSRDGQRFRIVTREGRHWKVPVRGRLRSQMSKAERRRLELRDERRKKLEKKTKLPEGYNDAADELEATADPVEREDFYAQVIESVGGKIDEGTPTWLKRCVASVAPQYGNDTGRAFAICTAQGQQSGLLKPGTGKPTEKGTSRAKSMGQEPGHKSKLGSYEKMLKRKKKKEEGEEIQMRKRDLKIGPHGLLEDPQGLTANWYDDGEKTGKIVDAFVHPRLSMAYVRVEMDGGKCLDVPAQVVQVEVVDDDTIEFDFIPPGDPSPFDALMEQTNALLESLAVPAEMLGVETPVNFGSVTIDDDGNRTWVRDEAAAVLSMVKARKEGIQRMRGVKSEFDRLLKPFGIRQANINYDVQLDYGEVEYVLKDPAATVCVVWDEVGRYFKLKGGWWLEIKAQVNGKDIVVKEHVGGTDAKPRDVAKAAEKSVQKLSG